ncbi:SMP-30/gluconolactonase/LRE family protein [Qipengyuania sp.]|uniref:SMP-30/gluconolactonase/LRE family protein n=1 Tax=Qipengyuania sp. TaxID=2004515 RepID=UPI0035C85212
MRVVQRDRTDRLGEGPLWSVRENALYWVDIIDRRINRLSFEDGHTNSFGQPDHTAWIIEREQGGFLAGIGRDAVFLDLPSNHIQRLCTVEHGKPANRLNDAKADGTGRVWAGTMPVSCDTPNGAFYRIDPDGTVCEVDSPYTIANGPAIDCGGAFLLHTDTATRTIFRFAINDDGTLGERQIYIEFESDWGNPDGMTFDADGGLWVACWGAGCVARFDSSGRRERAIALPASQITNCAFAGPDLDRMFVTSASEGVEEPYGGALFEIEPGCRGLLPNRFMG